VTFHQDNGALNQKLQLLRELLRFSTEDKAKAVEFRDLNNRGLIYNVLKQRHFFIAKLTQITEESKNGGGSPENRRNVRRQATRLQDEANFKPLAAIMQVFNLYY
jgi:hypothetical protein